MRKAALFTMILALALLAMPAMATHPNFIDRVLVTDVAAVDNPNLLYPDVQWQPDTMVNSRGIYPPDWGGEGIGQYGSQTMAHYVGNSAHGPGRQGSWKHRAMPTENAPVVVDFDLRQVYDMQSMVIWNYATYHSDPNTWYKQGVKDVTVYYKKAPWDAWTKYDDFIFAPEGFLRGTRPDGLYVGPGTNPWGSYSTSNAFIGETSVDIPAPGNITSGPIFNHFFYPLGGALTANSKRPVDISGIEAARFIRLEITSNWGDPGEVGISEIRFYQDGPGVFIDVDPFPNYNWGYVHPGNNLNFGDAYRMWTKPQQIWVYNLGTSQATLQSSSSEGPFGVEFPGDGGPVALAAADGVIYDMEIVTGQFAPTVMGSQSGKIHIQYSTGAGQFTETLNCTGSGKDVAFGYIPYAQADASQWCNPWWGGYEPRFAVIGQRPPYEGGGASMVEDLGAFVFGSKNAKLLPNVGNSWRTGGYPQYPGLPEVEGVVYAIDLGGVKPAEGSTPNAPIQGSAALSHKVAEVRIWNYNAVSVNSSGGRECMAAIRSVKIETSNSAENDFRDIPAGDWTQWGPDVVELEQPEPDVEISATDILDFSDVPAFRWWRFTTLGLAAGAAGANYGHGSMVGMGQIRFYTSKVNMTVTPAGHAFGNLKPYQSASAPEISMENVGTGQVVIKSLDWESDPGPFSYTFTGGTIPITMNPGNKIAGLNVTYSPILYGNYTANLEMQMIDNSDLTIPEAQRPVNNVVLSFSGSCNRMENGFIPVSHAWASSSWDGNWSPQWTYDVTGRGVREEPVGVWGSRAMKHWSNAGDRFLWHARQPGMLDFASHWVAWDFGSSKTLYDMLFWNAARTCCNGSARGFRKVKIQYTTDAPPTVNGGSEWGPWGGQSVPMEYSIAWDGLNWLELPATTMAIYPMVGTNMNDDGSFTTPDGWYAASNQVGGAPIQFQGRQARLVRVVADGPTWRDYYRSGNQDVWFAGGQDNYYNMAEARFYGPTSNAVYDITSHDFGSLAVGDTASFDITVTNLQSATAPLTIQGLFIEDRSGDGADAPYTFGNVTLPVSLNPGVSRTFTVTFEPDTAGDYNTFEAVILNDSPRNGLMQTALTGTAYEPGNSDVMLPATSVDFGLRYLQLGTQRVPFTVKNMGDTALTVDFTFDPSNVFGTTQADQLVVEPFSEAQVWLTVTPQALGETTGVMTLDTNDPDEMLVEVPLTVDVANAAAASVDGSWMLYE